MNEVLFGIVLLATATVVGAGIYFTVRAFRAVDRPPVEVKRRHDAAMIAQLRHFFEGKDCAACSRPIPPVHPGEPRPGLLNTKSHEAIAWDDIPAADLSATLESHVPICSNCQVMETFRRQHPELVAGRRPAIENPSH